MNKKTIFKSVIILSLVIALSFLCWFLTGTNCLFKALTGLPCPACGMTRAYLSLLKFDFNSAFNYHPLFWIVPLIAIYCVLPFFKKNISNHIAYKITAIIMIVAILACYIIRLILYFPHTEPMDYEFNSLIGRIIKWLFKL